MIKKIISTIHDDGSVKIKICDVLIQEQDNLDSVSGIIVEASNLTWKKQKLHTHKVNINGKNIDVIGHCNLGRKKKNEQYILMVLSDIRANDVEKIDVRGYRIAGRKYDYSDWKEFATNAEVVAFE